MTDDKRGESEPDSGLLDDVADAWAAVLIDIHEKRRGEERDDDDQGTQPCHQTESSASPT